jgi:hypothetical protein
MGAPILYDIAKDHLERVRVAVLGRHSMATLAKWLCENTTLGGDPFTFLDHEYQEPIVSDTSQEVAVQKPSQVGISEATIRLALAMVNVVSPMTVIYTLPTAKFASKFVRTRFDPVIQGSKVMRNAIHSSNDNSELKQFGDSFLYINGAASSNAPISIPADCIISDETDFSDQEVLSQYNSRLTHSKWRLVRKFSTPTLPGFGVNKAFMESRRHYNLCKCIHCNTWFQPDYYNHVRIPGYTGDLREVTKPLLARIRYKEAYVACPKCGGAVDLSPANRSLVCENSEEGLIGAGYQVTPFDAPKIIAASYLVEKSTSYVRIQDFVNFGLGLPMEDSEATLTREEIQALFCLDLAGSNTVYVMGVDVGNVYHFVIAAIDGFNDMLVVHTERVPMGKAKERYHALRAQYRVLCTVMDSNPHSETVMALQAVDVNMYAAVYMRSKSILTHNVVEKEADKEEGQEFHRQVNINRSKAFDGYMSYLRENHLRIREPFNEEEKELITAHHVSMKRVKVFDSESEEMSYSWQKTDGEDHYHHAFLYCWIAGKIRGVGKGLIILPTTYVTTFRLTSKVT